MKTIAKNRTAAIDAIFTAATKCTVYSDSNMYQGKECSKEWAKKELFQFSFAKLKRMSEKLYHVDVTSNCWYELEIGGQA